MGADVVIASNLRIARQDLDAAHILAAHDNRNAIYLCEQAAEKIIRAVLTRRVFAPESITISTPWSIWSPTRTL